MGSGCQQYTLAAAPGGPPGPGRGTPGRAAEGPPGNARPQGSCPGQPVHRVPYEGKKVPARESHLWTGWPSTGGPSKGWRVLSQWLFSAVKAREARTFVFQRAGVATPSTGRSQGVSGRRAPHACGRVAYVALAAAPGMPARGPAPGRPITGGLRPRAGGCAADGWWSELGRRRWGPC